MDRIVDIAELFGRRRRTGAGWSEFSWIKHNTVAKPVLGQVHAFRARFPAERMLLIDANAGDGIGVEKRRDDLFESMSVSKPTAELLTELAAQVGNADVCLCERNRDRRIELRDRYPNATIVADHGEIPTVVRGHSYALWLSDPNGPGGHGVTFMRATAQRVLCDFVIVCNEGAIKRISRTKSSGGWQTSRERYSAMLNPHWWLDQLRKRELARTHRVDQSSNFKFRVLVASNFLSDAARRSPFIEFFKREGSHGSARSVGGVEAGISPPHR